MRARKKISEMLDANTARSLCFVVEFGSITKAAERLQTTKSQVSRTISNLERRLDVRIFHRTNRKLKLTQVGGIVHDACQSIIATLDIADHQMNQIQVGVGQQIRIAAPIPIGNVILAPIVSEFLKANPALLFEAVWQTQTTNFLADGFDLAFQLGPLPDSALITRKIASFEYHCYAAPAYLAQKGAPASPAGLDLHDRISCAHKSFEPAWRFMIENSSFVVGDEARMIVNSYPLALQMCLDGLGIARLPSYYCETELRERKLVRVLNSFQQPKQDLFVLMGANTRLSNVSRQFLDLCVKRLRSEEFFQSKQ